jgi:hypothetical protein
MTIIMGDLSKQIIESKTEYNTLVNSLHTEPQVYAAGFRTTADYKECQTITDTTKKMEYYGFKTREK